MENSSVLLWRREEKELILKYINTAGNKESLVRRTDKMREKGNTSQNWRVILNFAFFCLMKIQFSKKC